MRKVTHGNSAAVLFSECALDDENQTHAFL